MNLLRKLIVVVAATSIALVAQADIQDLGTLGGSRSAAYDVNESGQVVGWSDTVSEGRQAFLWTEAGGMVGLGTLGGFGSTAWAISDNGQVVGESLTAGNDTHAFSWTAAGGMVDLGTLGGTNSYALAVNENGQVVGYSQLPGGYTHAFLWTDAGGMIDLGTLGTGPSSFSKALAVNDAGQVIGDSLTDDYYSRVFSWTQSGGMVNLGTLNGYVAFPGSVNNSGQVVGSADTPNASSRAFLWTQASGMIDLGTLTGALYSSSQGWDVNESGQVVGDSGTTPHETHAVLWTSAGNILDLGVPAGGVTSSARMVNDVGQVVGRFETTLGYEHVFAWTARDGIVDLGTLGGPFALATAVNNSGLVVGESWATEDAFSAHAVTWQISDGNINYVPDLNSNGASEVAVLVPGASNHVHVRDGSDDALITDIDFGSDLVFDIVVLPDLDASGDPEIAILQQQPSGQVRVQARDSVTGNVTSNLWYGLEYQAVSMAVVPDYNGNGFPEVAVLGSEAGTDAVRVQIRDADTNTFLDNVFLGTQSVARDLVSVTDTSGNGIPEMGILGVLKDNDQVRMQIWDADTATFLSNVWFAKVYQPHSTITMPDINGNSSDEIVAVGVDPATQNIRVQVRDSLSTATLYNIWLGAVNEAVDIKLINDINSDGFPDLAVLLETPAGTGRVRVQSGLNGVFIRNLFYSAVENPVGLAVMPDYSGNGFEELAVLGTNAGTQHVQILDTSTGSQVNRIDYP